MQNLQVIQSNSIGPLIGTNFSFSEQEVHDGIRNIAKKYDVSCITEKQKTAMSKELFDCGVISAIEHAILSLPNRHIEAVLAKQGPKDDAFNLIEFYQNKVETSRHFTNLSPAKAIDGKFLFIMQDLDKWHQQ